MCYNSVRWFSIVLTILADCDCLIVGIGRAFPLGILLRWTPRWYDYFLRLSRTDVARFLRQKCGMWWLTNTNLSTGLTMINMQSAFLIVSKGYTEKQAGILFFGKRFSHHLYYYTLVWFSVRLTAVVFINKQTQLLNYESCWNKSPLCQIRISPQL